MKKRVVIYCRTAHDDGYSLEWQRDGLLCFATRKGWNVVRSITEQGNGLSLKREGLSQLMAAVAVGEVDIVLVKDASRLCRETLALERCLNIMAQHATVLYAADTDMEVRHYPINLASMQRAGQARC